MTFIICVCTVFVIGDRHVSERDKRTRYGLPFVSVTVPVIDP
jgi:hypothetical protein